MPTETSSNGKSLYVHPLAKKNPTPVVQTKKTDAPVVVPTPAPLTTSRPSSQALPLPPSTKETKSLDPSTNTVFTRREVAPTTRIVVVRTTSSSTKEGAQTGAENKENEGGKSVELPAVCTDGRTSVYLIRRPIPTNETPRATKLFQPTESSTKMPSKTNDNERSPPGTSSKSRRIRSSRARSESPPLRSSLSNRPSSSTALGYEDLDQQRSPSPSPSENSHRRHRSRSRDRSRSRPTSPTDESSGRHEKEQRTASYLRPIIHKTDPTKKSNKSNNTVNVADQRSAGSDSTYPVTKRPVSTKKKRFRRKDESSPPPLEDPQKPIQCENCLLCLSRHIRLVLIICTIIFLIGLGGAGASIYFLATNASTGTAATIVGVVLGIILAIGALVFLYTVMICVGSCEGYFSFHAEGPRRGGKAFAIVPPSSSTTHVYRSRDYAELKENHRPASTSPLSASHVHPIPRQKTTVTEMTPPTSNGKHITIEMPERLLTGRTMSPTTHERSLNKVVKNIGHVVQEANKRYNGDVPNKVIVQVDPNAKTTV